MKVAAQIRQKLKTIPESEPFGYADLGIAPDDFFTAAKALERLQKKGEIKKVSKGIFYKPRQTAFGTLGPDYNALLKRNLYNNNKRVGYITGGELYNQLNLTTQNYFKTKIATSKGRKKINKGWLKTTNVKTYVPVTEKNYPLLGILDAVKDIRNIADTPTAQALKILTGKIMQLDKTEIERLLQYALQYPPRVRALLGAIVEYKFANKFKTVALQKSLNPYTTYKLGLTPTDLPTMKNWKLK
jgi:Family of unknown function (DUF6088)